MKNILTLVSFLLISSLCMSQPIIERCFEPVMNSHYAFSVTDSSGKIYATGRSQSFGISSPGWVSIIKPDGYIGLDTSVYFGDITLLNEIIQTADGNFLLCGHTSGCDYFPSQVGVVRKMTPSGSTIWTNYLNADTSINSVDNVLTYITELSNSHMAVTADSSLFYLDSFGDSIWSLILPGKITSLSSHGNSILCGTDTNLVVIDTNGVILNQQSFNSSIYHLETLTDSSYVLTSGNVVYTLDTGLAITNQFDLNSIGYQSDFMAFDTQSICFADTTGSLFICMDYSLILTDSFHIQIATSMNCESMSLRDSMIFILGSKGPYNSNRFYRTVSKHGVYQYPNADAGLIRIQFDSIVAYHPVGLPGGVEAIDYIARVTVKNFGSDTLHYVNVNTQLMSGGACGPTELIYPFTNLQVFPGDTIQLVLPLITEYGLILSLPYTYNFCAWTSCPDSIIDKDELNDKNCSSFIITQILAVNQIESAQIKIYPNPVSNYLQIEGIKFEKEMHYEIFDCMGKSLKRSVLDSGNIDVSDLNSGIYFIAIQSGENRIVKKFFKVD